MRVHALFGQMSTLVQRINSVRQILEQQAVALPGNDPLRKQLEQVETKADAIRKQVVATKEGGAITGEERLREHTDLLYGAILSWEGRPTAYQLARTEVLRAQLGKISAEFDTLLTSDLPRASDELNNRGLPRIVVPATAVVAVQTLRSVDAERSIRAAFTLH